MRGKPESVCSNSNEANAQWRHFILAYSGHCQTCKMKHFAKVVGYFHKKAMLEV